MLIFSNEPCTEQTKQNVETTTAEMEQRTLKAVTNMVEISQTVNLHSLLLEHCACEVEESVALFTSMHQVYSKVLIYFSLHTVSTYCI